MPCQNHAVLNDHVGAFVPRVEQLSVLGGVGDVGRGTAEHASVVRLRPVGIADPDQVPVHKVDASGLVPRVHVLRHQNLPIPRIRRRVVSTPEPMALEALAAVVVARTSVERILDRVVRHAVDVPTEDRVAGVAQQRTGRASAGRAVVAVIGILPEGISDLDRLPAVGRIVDRGRRRTADDAAVVSPHQHLGAADVPRADAGERGEVPAGPIGMLRRVWQVIAAVRLLDRDFATALQIVRAQVKPVAGGEQDVAVLHQVAERDVPRLGKCQSMRPRAAIVFRQVDRIVGERECPLAALRVDVRTDRRPSIPEMIGRGGRGRGVVGVQEVRAGHQHPTGGCGRSPQEPAAGHSR